MFQLYFILDAAKSRDLKNTFFELCEDTACLYVGDSINQLKDVAPYLLTFGEKIDDFLIQHKELAAGNAFGIFIKTKLSSKKLISHLRKFLITGTFDKQSMYFRYYDPRVFRRVIPLFKQDQLSLFFKDIEEFIIEDSANKLISFSYQQDIRELIQKDIALDDFSAEN